MPPEADAPGYLSERYARSQEHLGSLRPLRASGGRLLERAISGTDACDATGLYPLLACRDWDALPDDLAACGDLVSVVAVPDPHGEHDPPLLRRAFPDLVRPFKEHFVCELDRGPVGSRHHRYYGRRALRTLDVVEAADPAACLDEWTELYGHLVDRHALTGVHAFPRASFADQLTVPGTVMLRALEGGRAVAAQLWYLQRGVAYSHLTAVSPRGYELRAAYALHAAAADLLRDRVRLLHLGGGAGRGGGEGDGLAAFKAGWATGTRTAYLVGRILDPARYRALAAPAGAAAGGWFPAYRAGEPARGDL